VRRFPIPNNATDGKWWERADLLTRAIQSSSKRKTIQTKQGYTIEYDEINAAKERSHIEVIDRILGKGFGFTDEEIDFVINYDIKYRMSTDANEE
jgi:hypothetical protein